MLECVVNRKAKVVDSGLKTWGDLLRAMDRESAALGQTVTAVRFDGVDQPSFRDASSLAATLARVGRIEIETADRKYLLRTTLNAAAQSLPALAASTLTVARAFRGRDLTDAHRQLTALIEAVRTLTLLTLASASAAGAELERLPCGPGSGADVLGGVGVVLDSMAQWQLGRDWIAVADALEYDLAPALLQWGVVFEAMEGRYAA